MSAIRKGRRFVRLQGWWRQAFFAVYAPTFLLSFAQGLMVPMLPLYAKTFDVSDGWVAIAAAALATGTLFADVPAGLIMQRIGRRPAMIVGATAVAVAALGSGLAPWFGLLLFCQVIAGSGSALWGISRLAYITDVVKPSDRGRVLSSFGGFGRIGMFGGPAVGGFLGWALGLNTPFLLGSLVAATALVIAWRFVPESGADVAQAGRRRQIRWHLVGQVARENARELATAGSAQVFAQMLRAGRQLLIPLYGSTQLGLGPAEIGTIVSLAAMLDMTLFVPAGWLMDKFGRKAAAVPSFLIMGLGMLLIPLANDYGGLLLAAMVMGFGNGLGAGTMMTLGADLAPRDAIGEFLGVWRLIGDCGSVTGPLIVGSIAEHYGLGPAAYALCGVGALAATSLVVLVKETLQRDPPNP